MILRIGNEAFRGLSTVLDLPGTKHLADVDISTAFPVLELLPFMRRELIQRWTFQIEVANATVGGEDTVARISPYIGGDWTAVFNGSREITGTDEASLVGSGKEVLITNVGARLFDSVNAANFSSLVIEYQPSEGAALSGTPVQPLFHADQLISGVRMVSSLGETLIQPLPWNTIWATFLRFITTDPATAIVTLTCLVADRGILPWDAHIGV